jgi:hypothetical protein
MRQLADLCDFVLFDMCDKASRLEGKRGRVVPVEAASYFGSTSAKRCSQLYIRLCMSKVAGIVCLS